jgi:phosphatidylserine/phosphatidylglycerophosphate/cardiolipin synthase-like enzyme
MSVVDIIKNLVRDAPGAPQFAQPFTGVGAGTQDFGSDVAGEKFDAITITVTAGVKIQTPANCLLRYVPNLALLAEDKRRAFVDRWPDLRRLNGRSFDATAQSEGTLLLEIWPTAFRRLEGMFASVEIPIPDSDLTRPQTPVPRWFVFKGIARPELEGHVQTIANAQFPGGPAPDISKFFTGEIPIYAPYQSKLAEGVGGDVEIRAFDSSGLVVDPAVICGYFDTLAQDIFAAFAAPATTPFTSFPKRHIIVFSDAHGGPYVPFADPEPLAVAPDPRARLTIGTAGTITEDLGTPALLRYREAEPHYSELSNKVVVITVDGEHIRVGLHPHGTHERATSAAFGDWTFLRVRITDFARWFPKNANPLNTFTRYTEQNELVPLPDGQSAFRETYRTFRSTYVAEDYASDDAMPAGAPRPAIQAEASQIFMTNYSIVPENALLGRRAMLSAPRTQPGAVVPDDPLAGAVLIPRARITAGEQREWWLVSRLDVLPPGSAVELQPVGTGASFSGNDPRLPGKDSGADLFGITIFSADVVRVFANAQGQFFIPVVFAPEWEREAELRVITWEPSEADPDPLGTATTGKGKKKIHARGTINVPAPPSLTVPAAGAPWTANASLSISVGPTLGSAQLNIAANSLSADARIVIVNQRTGDTLPPQTVTASTTNEVTVTLENFSVNDVALVATLPIGDDLAAAESFFAAAVTNSIRAAGTIPAHPKELVGVLREAINAGVEVRFLGSGDLFSVPNDTLKARRGLAAALNAGVGSKRGEGIEDPILRETNLHHQKSAFIRSPAGVTAFVGGIDQAQSRWNTSEHEPVEPDRPTTSQWHDIHCKLRGKAVWDIFRNFHQRWNLAAVHPDVTSAGDIFTPVELFNTDDVDDPLITSISGTNAVQINRTLPRLVSEYAPILDTNFGDLSILTSYERTIANARDFLYIEDQYFWTIDIARQINERLRAPNGLKFVIMVLPRELSEFKIADLILYAIRVRAINMLCYGKEILGPGEDGTALPGYVGDRVLIAHLVNKEQDPIYVHCKTIIADDVWMSIGSSNLSMRSLTYDSELNAASIDSRISRGGHVSAREFRVRLMAEHLGLDLKERGLVEYPHDAFQLMKEVLDGKRPWLKHHLVRYDPTFTHYGIQPAEYNEVFLDGLNLILDPDGRHLDSGIDLMTIRGLIEHLNAANAGQAITFGGIGAIRVTFDTSGLSPAPLGIVVELTDVTPPDPVHPEPPEPAITRGPLDPTAQAIMGIFRIGRDYNLSADALDGTNTSIGNATTSVTATGFVTDVVLSF